MCVIDRRRRRDFQITGADSIMRRAHSGDCQTPYVRPSAPALRVEPIDLWGARDFANGAFTEPARLLSRNRRWRLRARTVIGRLSGP